MTTTFTEQLETMPETIFWDTAAFVALGNARDDLHHLAVNVSQELARINVYILTTDAVLTEVVNTFSKVNLRPIAWQIVEATETSVECLRNDLPV